MEVGEAEASRTECKRKARANGMGKVKDLSTT